MKIQITKKIGKSTLSIQVDGEKERDTLFKASTFTTMPDICGNCESENVILDGNLSDGYTFIKVKCLDCNYRSQMGELKAGGIFWKPFENYVPPKKKEEPKAEAKVAEEEDVTF